MGRANSFKTSVIFVSFLFFLAACEKQNNATTEPELTGSENLIIECQSDCRDVVPALALLEAQVNIYYQNIPALSVNLPRRNIAQLQATTGVTKILKDKKVPRPRPLQALTTQASVAASKSLSTQVLRKGSLTPKNYAFNNVDTKVRPLHQQAIDGQGVIVAVIDTGTANNPERVTALAGSVIGGENFVPLADEPSATSTLNDSHGTMVGSMIAAHAEFVVDQNPTPPPPDPNGDATNPIPSFTFLALVASLRQHSPDSVNDNADGSVSVPMVGTAPGASLYALKVFPMAADALADSSWVLAAMDRALSLKRAYNNGGSTEPVAGDGSEDKPYVYNALNIQVANLSLGGPALFPGQELEDRLIQQMLADGIVVVVAAGNEGNLTVTTGTPATSVAAISVGAASDYIHDRVLRDLRFGPGAGLDLRPNTGLQVAYFSSRGPTADGRTGIDIMANGYGIFAQTNTGLPKISAGTSFSSPTVAGIAALLWDGVDGQASATAVRAALINSANAAVFQNPGDTRIDRGNGYVDAEAALALLRSTPTAVLPVLPDVETLSTRVMENIVGYPVNIVNFGDNMAETYTATVTLNPGESVSYLAPTRLSTQTLQITLKSVYAGLPATEQSPLPGGDGIWVTLLDGAPLFKEDTFDERFGDATTDAVIAFASPRSGLSRIAILGDGKNAGPVSVSLEINQVTRELPPRFGRGTIRDEEEDHFRLEVGRRTSQLTAELSWTADWGSFPSHDIDLILVDPNGNVIIDGASLDSPERVVIDAPLKGRWDVYVIGYMLHGEKDRYRLSITDQNGRSLDD